ncbi:tetratricopeptide repeat protein [Candidatus Woesebacteria bacterium]|nr:MAG: tetratricopeptide repeat protein [Candidatus Woesebacteria bacterium]
MDIDLDNQAVSAALAGKWKEASKINLTILETNPSDVDALNRLARAYAEMGDLPLARATAQKVLKIDAFNSIANKSLNRWKGLKKTSGQPSTVSKANIFLEEPGKTKIVQLMHLGSAKVIATIDTGDEVKLNTHGHRVNICSCEGKYIGRLSDDLSGHIRNLIRYGNEYSVCIKSVEKEDVTVFIRETKRCKDLQDIPSFSSDKIDYMAFDPQSKSEDEDF